jgi:hypothetical protein
VLERFSFHSALRWGKLFDAVSKAFMLLLSRYRVSRLHMSIQLEGGGVKQFTYAVVLSSFLASTAFAAGLFGAESKSDRVSADDANKTRAAHLGRRPRQQLTSLTYGGTRARADGVCN